jgi:hypothetical protein
MSQLANEEVAIQCFVESLKQEAQNVNEITIENNQKVNDEKEDTNVEITSAFAFGLKYSLVQLLFNLDFLLDEPQYALYVREKKDSLLQPENPNLEDPFLMESPKRRKLNLVKRKKGQEVEESDVESWEEPIEIFDNLYDAKHCLITDQSRITKYYSHF